MKLKKVIDLHIALSSLDKFSGDFNAKTKWNLAKNLKKTEKEFSEFQEQRSSLFLKYSKGKDEILPSSQEAETFKNEINSLLDVDVEITLLGFQFSDVVRDDIKIPSSLLVGIEDLLEGKPD